MSCKTDKKLLQIAYWSLMLFCGVIVPATMIFFGARNPTINCEHTCVLQDCNMTGNTTYILPTPPIGINASQALIFGGAIFIVVEITITIVAFNNRNVIGCTPIYLLLAFSYLCSLAWMIVSFVVYKQTIDMCIAYKNQVFVVSNIVLLWLIYGNILCWIFQIIRCAILFRHACKCQSIGGCGNQESDEPPPEYTRGPSPEYTSDPEGHENSPPPYTPDDTSDDTPDDTSDDTPDDTPDDTMV
jgi:hypothetical protein